MKRMFRRAGLLCLLLAVTFCATSCGLLAAYEIVTETGSARLDGQTRTKIAFSLPDAADVTAEELEQVQTVLLARLSALPVDDVSIITDLAAARVTAEMVWNEGEEPADPGNIAGVLEQRSTLEFRKGSETTPDAEGDPVPAGELIITGNEVVTATVMMDPSGPEPTIRLTMTEQGKAAFAAATAAQARVGGTISVWLDGEMICNPTVQEAITEGEVIISGVGTQEEVEQMALSMTAAGRFFATMEMDECTTVGPAG